MGAQNWKTAVLCPGKHQGSNRIRRKEDFFDSRRTLSAKHYWIIIRKQGGLSFTACVVIVVAVGVWTACWRHLKWGSPDEPLITVRGIVNDDNYVGHGVVSTTRLLAWCSSSSSSIVVELRGEARGCCCCCCCSFEVESKRARRKRSFTSTQTINFDCLIN